MAPCEPLPIPMPQRPAPRFISIKNAVATITSGSNDEEMIIQRSQANMVIKFCEHAREDIEQAVVLVEDLAKYKRQHELEREPLELRISALEVTDAEEVYTLRMDLLDVHRLLKETLIQLYDTLDRQTCCGKLRHTKYLIEIVLDELKGLFGYVAGPATIDHARSDRICATLQPLYPGFLKILEDVKAELKAALENEDIWLVST